MIGLVTMAEGTCPLSAVALQHAVQGGGEFAAVERGAG
jgi:hypothetical protein